MRTKQVTEQEFFEDMLILFEQGIRKIIADAIMPSKDEIRRYWENGYSAEEAATKLLDSFHAQK